MAILNKHFYFMYLYDMQHFYLTGYFCGISYNLSRPQVSAQVSLALKARDSRKLESWLVGGER